MCGIVGIVGRLERADRARVVTMSDTLRHRGPDQDGVWHSLSPDGESPNGGPFDFGTADFGAVLGHRRLSILDLSVAAAQPMIDAASGAVLVFNGEIYNHQELRVQLKSMGATFVTTSDSEVLLKGYIAWGAGMVSRLRGMFAFVLFDPRDGTTLIARDGFGIKPLYLSWIRDKSGVRALAFASELRALLASGLIERHTDPRRIHRYLWNGFVTGPETLVRGIEEFPAGCYAVLSPSRLALTPVRFWSPGGVKGARRCDTGSAIGAIETGVGAHLRADVRLGVFLSGGIDSTAVAALAMKAQQSVETLSIGFDETASDESKTAEAVARILGTAHHTVRVSAQDMLDAIDTMLDSLDQPSMDGVNTWFVSRAAREQGWKVALAGTGGDELFGGYTSFRRMPRLSKIMAVMAPGEPIAARLSGLTHWGLSSRSKLSDLPATRGRLERLYQTSYALFARRTLEGMMDADPKKLDRWGLQSERLTELAADINRLSPLRAVSLLESRLFLGDRLLRDTDAVSMIHGLEVRTPLVDTILSDAMADVSDADRYGEIGSKPLLRRIAQDAVGADLLARPKRGFEFPFETWLRGPLRETVQEVLLDTDLCRSIGLQPARVRMIWNVYLTRPGLIYWTRIWALYVLLRWCGAQRVSC